MGISPYYRRLRQAIGHDLLLVPGVAGVIFEELGRVLLHRGAGGWGLPAGAIEPGESPTIAVEREVQEEMGLIVQAGDVLAVTGGEGCRVQYASGDLVEYVVTVFECVVCGGELDSSDNETLELGWWHVDALPQMSFPYPPHVFVRS